MSEKAPDCSTCRKPMEAGYIVDHSYGAVYPSAWVSGMPDWSRFFGLKLRGRTKMPLTAFRCPKCGRVESYAWPGEWRM